MRLTKDMKTEIVDALLAHKFKPLVAELAKEIAAFAVAAHAAHFGERLKLMNSLPEGWLNKYDRMDSVNYKDKYYTIYFNGHVSYNRNSDNVSVFEVYFGYNHGGGKSLRHLASDHDVKPVNTGPILEKVIALQEQFNEMKRELLITLHPFNNVDKLIEHWPEVKPFVPDYVPPVKNLPAVQSGELNAKLGLPV